MIDTADKTRKPDTKYPDFTKYPRKRPDKIHIAYKDRSFENAFFYMVYRSWRLFHISCWFYFFPFTVLIFTYTWPLFMLYTGKIDKIT